MVFTDPPYNVPIDGHVCGSGAVKHREFAMAVSEMSEAAFTTVLSENLGAMARVCWDGAIAFVCMDWRHMGELLAAGRTLILQHQDSHCPMKKSEGRQEITKQSIAN